MFDLKDKTLAAVFGALYVGLFFNWFIYLIQTNFEVMIGMTNELLLKGFIIGFSGYLIWDQLKLPYFVPYGWLGILLGFNFINYTLIPLMTPYPSLIGFGLAGTFSMEFLFFKTVVVGTFIYVAIKGLAYIMFGWGGNR